MKQMWYTVVESGLGPIHVAWTEVGISCLAVGEESDAAFEARCQASTGATPARSDERQGDMAAALQGWLAGEVYTGPIDLAGMSPFALRVLAACRAIPRGEVRTYAELAAEVGKPGAARAVGTVMRRNPVPLLIPCHRVVRGDGVIGNYSMGGAAVKERLLKLEGVRR